MTLLTAGSRHQAEVFLGRFRPVSPRATSKQARPFTSTPRLDAHIAWLVRPTAIRCHPLTAQIELTVDAGYEDVGEPVSVISLRIVSPKMAAAAFSSH